MSGLTTSGQLIDALLRHGVLASADCTPTVIETHISWVILAGEFAYKIKKPVNLGFVDFSSLEARRRACLEELRLNRRLTPELYLDVQVIHGNVDEPTLESRGPILEYAVKMKRFPPDSLVAGAPADRLTRREIDDLAALVAEFHRGLPRSTSGQPWGLPDQIWAPAADSLDQLGGLLSDDDGKRSLNRVRAFLEEQFHRNCQVMERRHAEGGVRECHGDLHLGNLVRIGGRIVPFDALEFNPALRWIDVMNEVAFLVMDLDTHGRQDLAFRFLNRYLDASGDHDGLRVLPFYLGYRALVRAKVRAMSPPGLAGGARPAVDSLLTYAGDPQSGRKPVLVLMSGLSGSGKSWLAAQLAESLPAIHVRSDVERKRLFALGALEQTAAARGAGIYTPDASARTYHRLREIAAETLGAGFPVIVDATNLRRDHRASFLAAAREAGCPAAIVVCQADLATIESRVRQRLAVGKDPSEARTETVERQRQEFEPPTAAEGGSVFVIESGRIKDAGNLTNTLRGLRFK